MMESNCPLSIHFQNKQMMVLTNRTPPCQKHDFSSAAFSFASQDSATSRSEVVTLRWALNELYLALFHEEKTVYRNKASPPLDHSTPVRLNA
jgi:hypothetical protein